MLNVPLRGQNRLFRLAGLPERYSARGEADPQVVPFESAIDQMIARHHPYPALVINGVWDVVKVNRAGVALMPPLAAGPVNLVHLLFGAEEMRQLMANWSEVARATLRRLESEARELEQDAPLHRWLAFARQRVLESGLDDVQPGHGEARGGAVDRGAAVDLLAVCPEFLIAKQRVRTVSIISRFNAPQDVNLEELRVELLFPRDAEAHSAFVALCADE